MNEDKSRSQKKRESAALQRIGEELILLPAPTLETLSLPKDLLEAVLVCQRLPQNESRRRQTQYVGRLMREVENPEEIQKGIDEIKSSMNASNVHFQHIENICQALLDQDKAQRDKALREFLYTYPQEDANRLRSLVKSALEETAKARETDRAGKSSKKPKGRALFRWLRETMEQAKPTINLPENPPD